MPKILFKKCEVNSRKKRIELLNRPEIKKIVNNPRERREVMNQLKKYSSGGVTKREAREILGKFHYNKKDSLDGRETASLAKALGIRGTHKYGSLEGSSAKSAIAKDIKESGAMSNRFSQNSRITLPKSKFSNNSKISFPGSSPTLRSIINK